MRMCNIEHMIDYDILQRLIFAIVVYPGRVVYRFTRDAEDKMRQNTRLHKEVVAQHVFHQRQSKLTNFLLAPTIRPT